MQFQSSPLSGPQLERVRTAPVRGTAAERGSAPLQEIDEDAVGAETVGMPYASLEQPQTADGLLHSIHSDIPGLPLHSGNFTWAAGPHNTCNYVLPGRLLSGSYPGHLAEPQHSAQILSLLDAGVDTFICLQEWDELTTRFTPYVGVARGLATQSESSKGRSAFPLEFWHCPIPDTHVTSDEMLERAVATIVEKLQQGRTLYVHCWGGHGRTGTVIVALLVKVYGLTSDMAAEFFLKVHVQRVNSRGGHWPHGREQSAQVKRIENAGPDLSTERLAHLDDWCTQPSLTRAKTQQSSKPSVKVSLPSRSRLASRSDSPSSSPQTC